MHGSASQWRLVATVVVMRWGNKASGWKFESLPGPTFLNSASGGFWLCFVFRRGFPRTLSLFAAAFPASLCTSLLLARYPPTLPDLLPFHSSLFWFRFSFLFGSSLCLCEAEKLENGRGMCEPATSWRSAERLLLCFGELIRFCCFCCCCCSSSLP